MSSLLGHCHGENWKSPTRSFGRSGKAKRTLQGTRKEQLTAVTLGDTSGLVVALQKACTSTTSIL